jgi:hypothetical protein
VKRNFLISHLEIGETWVDQGKNGLYSELDDDDDDDDDDDKKKELELN